LLYMPSNSPAANKQHAITFAPVEHDVHALLHKHHSQAYRLRLSSESNRVSYIEMMHHRRATIQPFYFFGANSTWTIQGLDPAPSSANYPGHNYPAGNIRPRNLGLNSSQLKTTDDTGLDVKISGKTSLNLDLGGSQWLTDAGKDININNDDHDLDLSLSILFDLR